MTTMTVPQSQIEYKRKVGKSKDKDLWHVKTTGGLHMITDWLGKVVGSGPHRAVARNIAQRFEPDIVWTELSKSDHYDISDFEHLLPQWIEQTNRMREMQNQPR
jgi:hypothetical protein